MMCFQKIAPALVAQLLGSGGRVDNVGEEHRRKDAVASRCGDRAGQKFRDRVSDPGGRMFVNEKEMVLSGQLEQLRPPGCAWRESARLPH
jgi:hypothetical protein